MVTRSQGEVSCQCPKGFLGTRCVPKLGCREKMAHEASAFALRKCPDSKGGYKDLSAGSQGHPLCPAPCLAQGREDVTPIMEGNPAREGGFDPG